jgi:hypothetical protein
MGGSICFLHEQQEKREKKSLGARTTRLGEFWSILEHIGAYSKLDN